MLVAGCGCSIGLPAGLWHLYGPVALEFGFGFAAMFWVMSWRSFEVAKLILKFDEELALASASASDENEELA